MYDYTNLRSIPEDLHCSRGPVSSMPGSQHSVPSGSMCDTHHDRPAVARIQGETDSFGCEYLLVCQECKDEIRKGQDEDYKRLQFCDWCRQEKSECRPHRDMDEGMSGPLYTVCGDCRSREIQRALEELDAETGAYDFVDDYNIDDDEDPLEYVTPNEWHARYAGSSILVQTRTGNIASWLSRREVEKFIRKHKGKLRGRRLVIYFS